MSLISGLRRLAVKIEQNNENDFKLPVSEQKKYLAHFRQPKDDIERSYFQYCCQMRFYNPILRTLINISSFPLLVFYWFKHNDEIVEEDSNTIFFADGKPENIIPDALKIKAGGIKIIENKRESLKREDKMFLLELVRRYPFSWHFLLKCLMKIRFYSYEIQKGNPRTIIVCNEYSFTSSVLTKYCEKSGIDHINVMHGEKYYYIRDAFFHFDRCYVWDDYYVNLFYSLRAERSQFIVATPRSLRFSNCFKVEKEIDFTYYLGGETNEALEKIATAMRTLAEQGKRVSIRPHPRYSSQETIMKVFSELPIEDANINIEKSVLRTKNAVSAYSTVLNQAYHNGISVVIDDISDTNRYLKLKELGYIMLNKEHKLLSDVVRGIYEK